jgi:predicted ester cyclase
MKAEENKAIVRRFWGVWEGNIGLVDELVAPDYVNHSPGIPDQPEGPEGIKVLVSKFRGGMLDLRAVIDDMIAEGDRVAVRYTIEGTHEGEQFGVLPTDRRLSIESCTVERVSDGKTREHWRVTDTLDMMQQLGAIPTPQHA